MISLCPTCGNFVPSLEIHVDTANNHVSRHGKIVKITPRQAILLDMLAKAFPHAVRDDRIAFAFWGGSQGPEDENAVIRSIVSQLRHQIEPLDLAIKNDRGVGYELRKAPERGEYGEVAT
mgnify:CR=1 FL=1